MQTQMEASFPAHIQLLIRAFVNQLAHSRCYCSVTRVGLLHVYFDWCLMHVAIRSNNASWQLQEHKGCDSTYLSDFGELLLHCRLPVVREHVDVVAKQHEEIGTVCNSLGSQVRPDPAYVSLEHWREAHKVYAKATKKPLHHTSSGVHGHGDWPSA